MKKQQWIILAVVVVVAAIAIGVLIGQKNDLQAQVESLTAQVTTLNDQLTAALDEQKAAEAAAAAAEAQAEAIRAAARANTPLVVAYSPFSEKFSPFVADTGYDQDVVDMTQVSLMTTDRTGAIIFNAIEGETHTYNGTDYTYTGIADLSVEYDKEADITTYTAKIRDDIVFSDGVPMTADDIIFTYYTYLDTSYVGSNTLASYDIIGLQSYRTQVPEEAYETYLAMAKAIVEAGRDHVWAEGDAFTAEQQASYWKLLDEKWADATQAITTYCLANYEGYIPSYTGMTAEEVLADPAKHTMVGMALWGFGGMETAKVLDEAGAPVLDENGNEKTEMTGVFVTKSGKTFDTKAGQFPTNEDYLAEAVASYAGDVAKFYEVEVCDGMKDPAAEAQTAFISEWSGKDTTVASGVPNISGIKKLDDYTVQVQVRGFSAPAVYQILGINVAPLHYYGDVAQYDYENNMFGFPRGDVSLMMSKTSAPLGAGAYKFVKYENRIVYFEANENYYKGKPKTNYIQFKETAANEVAPGVQTGAVDAGEMTGSKSNFEQVASYNSNGEITGDVVTTSLVNNLGYGYIGINADRVRVGEESASDASKNLRRALATVLAVYRDVSVDSYYGTAAQVIQYPISNTSWAAPQPTDEGYQMAFSVDAEGNALYTAEMTAEEKYAAALEGAKGFLAAAGYTFGEDGKAIAPEGGRTEFEIIVPADGIGDHPSFQICTDAKAALETIGITLVINDPADSNVLWDKMDAGEQDLWCAAWSSTIDPDMYQVYHSSGIVGLGGSDSNHYHIADATLDQYILDARTSDDQAYRKAVYKQALDLIIDWAVEIPTYQRQNSIIFSTQRINMDTVTPDITTFWGWMAEVELIEMNDTLETEPADATAA